MKDGKYVILCVDDDQDILDNLSLVFEVNGYDVVQAHTAEEGLEIYGKFRADLVIVDLMMEEVDAGTSFVKELRARGSDIPVYMLSSLGDSLNTTTDAAAMGLSGVIQKPVSPESLLNIVRAKLE